MADQEGIRYQEAYSMRKEAFKELRKPKYARRLKQHYRQTRRHQAMASKGIRVTNEIRTAEKPVITIEECAALYSIGENKLRNIISNDPHAPWLMRSGSWVRIKRKQFDAFIDTVDTL